MRPFQTKTYGWPISCRCSDAEAIPKRSSKESSEQSRNLHRLAVFFSDRPRLPKRHRLSTCATPVRIRRGQARRCQSHGIFRCLVFSSASLTARTCSGEGPFLSSSTKATQSSCFSGLARLSAIGRRCPEACYVCWPRVWAGGTAQLRRLARRRSTPRRAEPGARPSDPAVLSRIVCDQPPVRRLNF